MFFLHFLFLFFNIIIKSCIIYCRVTNLTRLLVLIIRTINYNSSLTIIFVDRNHRKTRKLYAKHVIVLFHKIEAFISYNPTTKSSAARVSCLLKFAFVRTARHHRGSNRNYGRRASIIAGRVQSGPRHHDNALTGDREHLHDKPCMQGNMFIKAS